MSAVLGVGDSALEDVGIHITVRGDASNSDDSFARANTILRGLHGLRNVEIGTRTYLAIRAMTPEPVFLGFDETARPRHSIAFRMLRLVDSPPTSGDPQIVARQITYLITREINFDDVDLATGISLNWTQPAGSTLLQVAARIEANEGWDVDPELAYLYVGTNAPNYNNWESGNIQLPLLSTPSVYPEFAELSGSKILPWVVPLADALPLFARVVTLGTPTQGRVTLMFEFAPPL
jgi:hypothetical protein